MIRPARCSLILIAALAASGRADEVSFNRDIRPILSDRCFACHGPDAHERKAKLRLDRADGPEGAYRTHDDITAIKPGSLEDSELWFRLTTDVEGDLMPPPKSNKKRLSKAELDLFKRWIESGAKYDGFWAFEPIRKPARPEVQDESWSTNPIDLHVLRKLESAGMKPSEEADQRQLIRRVTFDLTGLPPSREQVHAFLKDGRPGAYEALVDRLLASPQYGEHMARYWLDLVRYGDTNGMHKDFYRNHFAYRDWVIRAFNDNLGYDDFTRYQLAGDLYPEPTQDQLIASGFHRLHLIIDRGTALPEESYAKNVFDRVTSVGTAFMGLTLNCAMCHDHKYDPLTQKDFYSMFAFFNNIDAQPETRGRPRNGLQPPYISLATDAQKKKLAELDRQAAQLDKAWKAAEAARKKEKDAAKKKQLEQQAKSLDSKRKAARQKRDAYDRTLPYAMVMKERQEIRPAYLLNRGEYDKPGKQVPRNTPAFLPPLKKQGDTATRMDLAEWFVDPSNPLTARTAANRFWQQFFGVGLVKTSEDLGAQGEVPSHPALLDELAASFIESGWDVKALVKRIVMSRTYRQASSATPEQFRKDPQNRLLARGSRFRLDAEMIRDQILATSGLLSSKMYGPSVKPPQPDGLWKAVTMIGERFKPDAGEAIHRRSVYTYWKRAMPPPQMTILNAPNRNACVARRERTNTPTQALLLLNESQYMKAAQHLAQATLGQEGLGAPQRIDRAYEVVTSRLPDAGERRIFIKLIEDLQRLYRADPKAAAQLCADAGPRDDAARAELAAWTVFANLLYNMDITKTRE